MTQIITTEDGSSTLIHPILNEQYHSLKGALVESSHIFISLGLDHCKQSHPKVLEMGFGTGLNALLSKQYVENKLSLPKNKEIQNIEYTSIELYPLLSKDTDLLNYEPKEVLQALHQAPWNKKILFSPNFELHKIKGDLLKSSLPTNYFDVIYYDAFSPETQPELWSQEVFNHLYELMAPKGILTTYCAKGVVRRAMQSAGFIVERMPGPPNGKREVLRATKA